MHEDSTHPFLLDAHPAKADPALIRDDVAQFARIGDSLARQISVLESRLAEQRRAPAGHGQAALDRDLEIHRLTARLRMLRRFGLDLCLGRIVGAHGTLYIGRLALTDDAGEPLLVDWRAPAAEPFFGATHAQPMGLTSRRRYRWNDGRITDYWDEAFTPEALAVGRALDDQSAFIASLAASRSPRMRDVLGTIQADQDAIIRAGSRGALVVDGGPGTGKTVVALHRAAYLLYADPRLQDGRGGVLFVGPSHAYTAYVADILPGLGEEGVRITPLADLVPEGSQAVEETDRDVARLKASALVVDAVDAAVRLRERPPARDVLVDTAWGDLSRIGASDWEEAFGAIEPGATHNEARAQAWDALMRILVDRVGAAPREGAEAEDSGPDDRWADEGWGDAGTTAWDEERLAEDAPADEEDFDAYGLVGEDGDEAVRGALAESERLRAAFDAAWPLLDPVALVRALWTDPALLRRCAPGLTAADVAALQRPADAPWTRADLPLLDAARLRVGDPEAEIRRRRAEAEAAAERARMDDVVADFIATDDSDLRVMSMLRGQDLRGTLAVPAVTAPAGEPLAGPFAHIVVDEAQELTDAEWRMLLRRNPSRSFTIVGDRAQARHGFTRSWKQRLADAGLRDVSIAALTVNYRTPEEVMAEAEPVIRRAIPDANVPTSIRRSGIPVRRGTIAQRDALLAAWTAENDEGVACVIGDPSFVGSDRMRSLSPAEAKGLEYDLVVLVDPDGWGEGIEATVDRYVAMTRTTRELVILSGV
ncbi:AAA family ATPase [Microbacterium paludicola]|uniref:AAA family ATPase n=1 Tax=Microbacterium paludicola TaxID=300019 RepID=A0A4Y9FXQ8_9MICO|nr:AAA family ATPase [Microbacterium paludicola]MBF0815208.1 AAA family ATPase [Microbacterium paludicola]TFU34085.1 AAA family ATPase [Microbacterium paludicola]